MSKGSETEEEWSDCFAAKSIASRSGRLMWSEIHKKVTENKADDMENDEEYGYVGR